ncbi:hypothetical protein ITI46_16545 [Streptomyces oryzae]|uniref:Uncharacterized protein n=1 Tax=Streptomyces oryzae TaxID=1434886 RepID=A0ABS3XD03_9ACTN|nr:hypothetical protein [Streptomyces oryzae]MBO8193264.1 hypothetical protein [Streptomyces oryzae]
MAGARILTRAVTALGGTALLATAAVAATASPAGAAESQGGSVRICAAGTYDTSASLQATGNDQSWTTRIIGPGSCVNAPSSSSGRIDVFGYKSPSQFHVGSVDYKAGQTVVISTTGTTANPKVVVNGAGGGTFVKN